MRGVAPRERNWKDDLMSVGSMGARAALVAAGVLVSVALMAAPSWAAKGGNSANAKLCETGGYPGVLLAQDGSSFKNEGQCTKYAAKGGQLAGVNGVPGPVEEPFGFREWTATFSGFGLKPGSTTFAGYRYEPSFVSNGGFAEVNSEGTFTAPISEACEQSFGTATGPMVIEATTAAGTVFIREFSRPSGC
jgi:hypothetical protein